MNLTETKHTPGPWRACHEGNCSCGMVWATGAGIDFPVAAALSSCKMHEGYNLGEGLSNQSEEYKANAKLIAAAPDLLKALEALVEKCLHSDGYDQKYDELYHAQQAIQKATS